MHQYLGLLKHIMDTGTDVNDRTGTGTRSIFGYQMRFDLQKGFPLVTTKKTHLKSIIYELLWFLQGDTNTKFLKEHDVKIWDEWADANGDLGPVYGKQWRSWQGANGKTIDQMTWLINRLKTHPDCRRLIISAWNVAELEDMKLMPCHCLFQFKSYPMSLPQRQVWVKENKPEIFEHGMTDTALDNIGVPKRSLHCQLYQRSCDTFLGVPFNIASYALLTMMVAQVVDMAPGDFIWTGGDVHIYNNHFDQVALQLSRTPYDLPTMKINPSVKSIFDFKFEDFELMNYKSDPGIKAPISV